MQVVYRATAVATPMHRAAKMRSRIVGAVDVDAGSLDNVDRRSHHREDGVVGRQEFSELVVTGLCCKKT
jgi:hypothetical protein